MKYVKMTLEDAIKRCNKHTKVLVAIQDLEEDNIDIVFSLKRREEYKKLFEDVKIASYLNDEFIKQLNLFTEMQNIYDIKPKGFQKIVLLE